MQCPCLRTLQQQVTCTDANVAQQRTPTNLLHQRLAEDEAEQRQALLECILATHPHGRLS